MSTTISYYASKYEIDVIVLIEDFISPALLLSNLNSKAPKYHFCKKNSRGISIYTSFGMKSFEDQNTNSKYLSLVEFRFLTKSILFGGIHLPSKRNPMSDPAKSFTSKEIRKEVEDIENKVGHNNTILVGDFNMNPFELGMVEPEGFNSVMSREIANKVIRRVSGKGTGISGEYKYFYNPMWSFLGDLSKFLPGTFYFHENNFDNHYRWHMLDQILIRPALISNFESASLKIIDSDESGAILINEKATSKVKTQLCDHLPVLFSMDLTK